jgi:hypothetical protein
MEIPAEERLHIACGLTGVLRELVKPKSLDKEVTEYLESLSSITCASPGHPQKPN